MWLGKNGAEHLEARTVASDEVEKAVWIPGVPSAHSPADLSSRAGLGSSNILWPFS